MNNLVFILSSQQAGAVKKLAEVCKRKNMNTCLLTDVINDDNSQYCDDHLLVRWESNYLHIVSEYMLAKNMRKAMTINLLEELLDHQKLLAHLLESEQEKMLLALGKLANKTTLRLLENVDEIFYGSLSALQDIQPTTFPVIIKPDRASGGSKYVYTCESETELQNIIRLLSKDNNAMNLSYIIEPYFLGKEFSVDCMVFNGEIIPLLFAEKIDFNYAHNMDGERILAPSVSLSTDNKHDILRKILQLSRMVELNNALLHVEFRLNNNICKIIEINPRFGGRMYASAIQYFTGKDVISLFVDMQLLQHENSIKLDGVMQAKSYLMFVTFHGDPGRIIQKSNHSDIAKIQFVYDYFFIPGFKCVKHRRENIFAEFLIKGNSVNQLLTREKKIRGIYSYQYMD